jgi:hypothetical protein
VPETTTDTTTVVDVDLDSEPACERPPEDCVSGGNSPAIASLCVDFYSTCEHRYNLLVCHPCLDAMVRVWYRRLLLGCIVCDDVHRCKLSCHVRAVLL